MAGPHLTNCPPPPLPHYVVVNKTQWPRDLTSPDVCAYNLGGKKQLKIPELLNIAAYAYHACVEHLFCLRPLPHCFFFGGAQE